MLRTLRGHSDAVRTSQFIPQSTQLFTTADDTTARVWDIPTESVLHSFSTHTDYVRAGTVFPESPHLAITGGYDHHLFLHDLRSPTTPALHFPKLNHPIEAVKVVPGEHMLAVAAGPAVHLFDTLTTRLIGSIRAFQKTVTTLDIVPFTPQERHSERGIALACGGLDAILKLYNLSQPILFSQNHPSAQHDQDATWPLMHAFTYPAPILSCALSKEADTLCVGMTQSIAELKYRKSSPSSSLLPAADSIQRIPGMKARKNTSYLPEIHPAQQGQTRVDLVVKKERKPVNLTRYERELKAFRYADALDITLRQVFPLLFPLH